MTKKKRSADDLFKLYRSFVKQYPISKFVVATKCVEYLHQFELAQHFYNVDLKIKFSYLTKELVALTEEEKQTRLMIDELERNVLLEFYFKSDDDDSEIEILDEEIKAKMEFNLEQLKLRLDEVLIDQKKVQIEIDNISIEGKVCQLDFSKFITTDTILGNTFEIGLVTDERKKGDIVGRKGILAADLTKQEAEEEEEELYVA